MRIVLDIGHIFKISAPHDEGAVFGNLIERKLAAQYAITAKYLLRNHSVFMTDPTQGILVGDYHTRITWANNNKIDLYVACHINAGGGKYGLVEITDDGHKKSKTVADEACKQMQTFLGYDQSHTKIFTLSKADRGYSCIGGLSMPAIIFEPYFIDSPDIKKSSDDVANAIVGTVNNFGIINKWLHSLKLK
jgi:N-acetylmuramoyl-L-alanine amidase